MSILALVVEGCIFIRQGHDRSWIYCSSSSSSSSSSIGHGFSSSSSSSSS